MNEGQRARGTKKKLIICCDGTACREAPQTNLTNVSRIRRCISVYDDDGIPQIVRYQPGVGTDPHNPLRAVDQATGAGIYENIEDAYSFICQNYGCADDEIYLIGFSRGAFTVRCIAQLINQIGLLTMTHLQQFPNIFHDWRKGQLDHALLNQLHQPDSYRSPAAVRIQVCAVWDTVSSIGLLGSLSQHSTHRLPFVNSDLCRNINHAFQALALHERRSKFRPIVWRTREYKDDTDPGKVGGSQNVPDLQQCWFLGYHSDIGGGQKKDSLAQLALVWMISKLRAYLRFDFTPIWDEYDSPSEQGKKPTWRIAHKTMRDHGEDFNNMLKDSKKMFYHLLGSAHRIPRCQFLSSQGFQETNPSDNSNENMHYSVRMLLERETVPKCKILQNGDVGRHNANGWIWKLRPGTPVAQYTIMEHALDDFEKDLLRKWLNRELIYIQDRAGQSDRDPGTIIAELLAFLGRQ